MTEWLILFIFIVCLIICKIYVKQNIILFVIYLLMKNIICIFVPCSFKGGEGGRKKGKSFFCWGGAIVDLSFKRGGATVDLSFYGGVGWPSKQIKKALSRGTPVNIFFRKKGLILQMIA